MLFIQRLGLATEPRSIVGCRRIFNTMGSTRWVDFMATVYRKTVTRSIPESAERIERKGVLFVRFTAKGERKAARVVIGKEGQERMTMKAETFTAKYRDYMGIVREIPTS